MTQASNTASEPSAYLDEIERRFYEYRERALEAEARVEALEAALTWIATDSRSAYGVAEQGGAREMARRALRAADG